MEALEEIGKEKTIVLPLHPRTKSKLKYYGIVPKNILFIDPVGYLEMVWLLDRCDLVMTDSGGLQKEAFFFQKPCMTIRDETEWVELVENGYNALCGVEKSQIIETFKSFRFNTDFSKDLYGSGKASEVIVKELLNV